MPSSIPGLLCPFCQCTDWVSKLLKASSRNVQPNPESGWSFGMRLWSVKHDRTSCLGKGNMPKMSSLSIMLVSFVSVIVCTRINELPLSSKTKHERLPTPGYQFRCRLRTALPLSANKDRKIQTRTAMPNATISNMARLMSDSLDPSLPTHSPCHSIQRVQSEDIQDQPSRCVPVQ